MADLSSLLNVAQGQGAPANPVFNVTPQGSNPNPLSGISTNAIFNALPNSQQTSILNNLYKQDMNRTPDQGGMNFWEKQPLTVQQLQQAFYTSQEANANGNKPPVPSQAGMITPAQQSWMDQAKAQTAGINAMPYVLDPSKLSTDTAANKALMYPSILQQGGAPYTPVAGKNIGPGLATQSPGTDFSGAGTMDALVKMVSDKTGMSASDAQNWITSLLPAATSSTDPNASLGAARNIPADTSAYNTASQN